MKTDARSVLLLCIVLAPTLFLSAAHGDEPGSRQMFDFDWRFANGDPAGAEKPEFDDAGWQAVDLPHDFAIYGPFDKQAKGGGALGYRPLGIGWYRKSFTTPPGLEGKRAWLEFEGVYRAAKVSLNGVPTRTHKWVPAGCPAEHLNGYTGFECDLTPRLKPAGGTNVVAVRADNSLPDTSRWYTGGGIYRHVWLRIAGKVHIAPYGTYVTTPKITAEEALVNVQTEVQDQGAADCWATLTSEVLDAGGKPVATATSVVPIRAGEILTVRQQLAVAEPKLWTLAEPTLYRLRSRLNTDGRQTDVCDTSFGIREIRVTPDGLFLNGKRELVKGFCIHHDLGCLGAAALDRAIQRRLETIKEIGCNAVRLSHNPHAPALLDLCDRLGLLVFDEAFDDRSGEYYGTKEAFQRLWPADLEWFLRRDRNHPSVFIWSVGNEGHDIFVPPDYGVNQSTAMADVVRRLDPSRPVTQALYPMRWNGAHEDPAKPDPKWREGPPHQVAFRMDVMSANYMEKHFAQDRLKYPQLSYIASESGTNRLGRGGWRVLDRQHAVGLFYWGGIDYLGESTWPYKAWSTGFVDLAGFRRASSYDVQSRFSDRPMVYLAVDDQWDRPSHWNFAAGRKLKVEAFSNAQEVELLLNGRSLGARYRRGEPGMHPTLIWDVPFAPGTLLGVARNAGKEVARCELRTAAAARAVRLTCDVPRLRADGQDLAHITVEVVDAAGVVVPDASQRVTFAVAGAGVNAGVDNGDPASDELFQANGRSAFHGRALLVVRAKRQPGRITVRASAAGLEPATLTIEAPCLTGGTVVPRISAEWRGTRRYREE